MQELDSIYKNLLSIGLIHTRDLLNEGRVIEAKLEMDHLYAIAQLLGSLFVCQYRFYLDNLRTVFISEAQVLGEESFVNYIIKQYVPIWALLEVVIGRRFGEV